jgi:hypothetical protein
VAQPRRPRGGNKKRLTAENIIHCYLPTDGCPPLVAHGGGGAEYRAKWLRRFAETVAGDTKNATVWEQLAERCDTSYLIDLLYLFTYRGKVLVDKHTSAHHLLRDRLKKLVRLYEKLNGELRRLLNDQQLSNALIYVGPSLVEQSKLLGQALDVARETASTWGSYKTDPRDWYLHLLATHVREATGSSEVPAIIALIEASRIAHGERREVFTDEGTVRKRLQRYEKRLLKPQRPRPPSPRISNEDDPIPF